MPYMNDLPWMINETRHSLYAFVDCLSMAEYILKHMKVSSIILTAGLFLTCNVLPETMTTLSTND